MVNDLLNLPRAISNQERADGDLVRFKLRCDLDLVSESRDVFGKVLVHRMGLSGFGGSRYYLAQKGDLDAVKKLHMQETGVAAELARREAAGETAPTVTFVVTELPD